MYLIYGGFMQCITIRNSRFDLVAWKKKAGLFPTGSMGPMGKWSKKMGGGRLIPLGWPNTFGSRPRIYIYISIDYIYINAYNSLKWWFDGFFFHGTKRCKKITNQKKNKIFQMVFFRWCDFFLGKKPQVKRRWTKAQTIGARKSSTTSGDAGKAKLHFLPGTLNKPKPLMVVSKSGIPFFIVWMVLKPW